ncbi:glycine N-acyltransferase-like protein 1 isoform X2 [Nycticebus coucang]|nr:glycine N-acyltransferase-like protein 1 isoform X2 [Nycticebus coucang]XP_053416070.1 glycine N-acyltransferase-like protein 1 isoform X2 [Nycticebus coucang]
MILLNNSQKLLTLYKSLARNIPESLKVYGSVYYINHGNPFNMQVLVDSWPEYQTVIVRPQKQEMTDNMDLYRNVYRIFTKVPQKVPEVLENCEVINWGQIFQIQGCQESLGEGIRAVAFSKSVRVKYVKASLYINEDILKLKVSDESKAGSSYEAGLREVEHESGDPNFKFSRLDVSHAGLINAIWRPGRNERSLRYVQECLQKLPAYCLLGPDGVLVSWVGMESSCEAGMAYTVERYRRKGKMTQLMWSYMKYLHQKNIPFYVAILEGNEKAHRCIMQCDFFAAACGWHQWICYPPKINSIC